MSIQKSVDRIWHTCSIKISVSTSHLLMIYILYGFGKLSREWPIFQGWFCALSWFALLLVFSFLFWINYRSLRIQIHFLPNLGNTDNIVHWPKVSVESQRKSMWSFSMNPFLKRHESNEAANPGLHQAFMSPLMIALPASSTHTQDMFDQLRTAAELELIEIRAFIPGKFQV